MIIPIKCNVKYDPELMGFKSTRNESKEHSFAQKKAEKR